jgi:hypothetical protein
VDEGRPDPGKASDLAGFTRLLGELVIWAGSPSHRELAKRAGPLLRPPQTLSKSTITDVFLSRRRRLNLDLVVAIVRALDVGEPEVDRWRRACIRVHAEAKSGGPSGVLRQLPADLATFTGRTAELDRLGTAVQNAPDSAPTVVISAIEGMGGVGKTQLAIHLAHRLVRAGSFPDAQLYVNLRGFDPEHPPADPAEVLAAFLRQLQVPGQQIPQTVDERAAMFRDRLHGRRAIVVLDNAADERHVRDLIPSAPGCLVLITSRRSLAALPDAMVLHLDVLPVRDAIALLTTIAGSERVRAEPEAAEQIVTLCGALPLAVALAATRLRSRSTWSLADLAERLGTGLPALTVGATNVRQVFAMSFDGLPTSAQTVFRLLGLHPGPDYTVQSAAALAGIPISTAREALELLHDEHLLRQRSFGRYETHDLLRRYLLEQCESLDAPTRAQASDRLLDYYTHSACSAAMVQYPSRDPLLLPLDAPPDVVDKFADAQAAQRWFDEEFAVLRALITHTAANRPAGAWQLAWSMVGHCINAGRLRELVEVQSVALSTAQTLGELPAQGFSWRTRGLAYRLLREFDAATARPRAGHRSLPHHRRHRDGSAHIHRYREHTFVPQGLRRLPETGSCSTVPEPGHHQPGEGHSRPGTEPHRLEPGPPRGARGRHRALHPGEDPVRRGRRLLGPGRRPGQPGPRLLPNRPVRPGHRHLPRSPRPDRAPWPATAPGRSPVQPRRRAPPGGRPPAGAPDMAEVIRDLPVARTRPGRGHQERDRPTRLSGRAEDA